MDTQVSPLTRLTQRAHVFFQEQLGIPYAALVAPIDPALPSGSALRQGTIYSTIEKARREDDSSLPRGGWEYELKRADWDKVSAIAADALRHKSKDLQLATWLLEAQIHRSGLAGIAPCLLLMQVLCERFWETLYPAAEGGDFEFRANVFRWINEKLLPALRLVPLVVSEREGYYRWADWEQARRNEQIRANLSSQEAEALEGASAAQLTAALSSTATDVCIELHASLADALLSIELLTQTIDSKLGSSAPSMSKIAGLLGQMHGLLQAELDKRGVFHFSAPTGSTSAMRADSPVNINNAVTPFGPAAPASNITAPGQPLRDRFDAYARLAEAADFLMRIEPHSPTPYLVQRAVEWGRMNTAELYQEVFLRLGGQLNIFEMLGLQPSEQQDNRQT